MLSVKHLTRKYKNGSSYVKAVDDITRNFNKGDFVFVLGASGSGKSTLLNVLCGLDTDIEGSVEIEGLNTANFTKKDWAIYRNHYVGFIFQEYNLIEHLKIWENVALPLMFQGVSKSEAKEKAMAELDRVGLSKFSKKYPNQMSGGQNQRVAIARALVTNPRVIMADEPTGALDTALSERVIEYLKKVANDRVVVVVTHDEDLAHKYASRIITLEDGKVINDSLERDEELHNKKELDFKQPKMKIGMMLKFAYNNISSRILRSLLTSTIVSIGYVSIFLLTFLILGINSSISEAIGSLVPEDQYQIYPVENQEITELTLAEINDLEFVDNIRYNVSSPAFFKSRINDLVNVTIIPIPFDETLLTQNGSLIGSMPQNDSEIVISLNTAAQMRGLISIDKESYEYIFQLLDGEVIELEYYDINSIDVDAVVSLGSYTIVGMSSADQFTSAIYADYDEVITMADTVYEDPNYNSVAVAYLNTTEDLEIEQLTKVLRDDYDLVLENFFESITSGVEEFMFKALKWLVGIASITLIVSGILIGLVVYTSIIERIKEIGILTAIGARSSNIVGIFITESALLGLLSSIIATVIALLITSVLNGAFNNFIAKPLEFITQGDLDMTILTPNVLVVLIVILFSIVYAVIAGLIPAFRASRLNAVKALRKE